MTTVKLDTEGFIATITISRPESLNALNKTVVQELAGCIEKVRNQKSLRVVIVTGEGPKAFVAGADIKEMSDMRAQQAQELSRHGQHMLSTLENLPQVSIAAVNGFALGGGLELALACDFIVASKTARLGLPEVSLGLIPGYGGTQRLARSVGINWARRIIFSGETLTADEAKSIGLVTEVVEPTELMTRVKQIAGVMASRSPNAIKQAKTALLQGLDITLEKGLEVETEHFALCFAHANSREGIAAFMEKRKVEFS